MRDDNKLCTKSKQKDENDIYAAAIYLYMSKRDLRSALRLYKELIKEKQCIPHQFITSKLLSGCASKITKYRNRQIKKKSDDSTKTDNLYHIRIERVIAKLKRKSEWIFSINSTLYGYEMIKIDVFNSMLHVYACAG